MRASSTRAEMKKKTLRIVSIKSFHIGEEGAYIAIIETAKQAVMSWHACLKLGRTVTPPFGAGTVLDPSASPVPKMVSTVPLQLRAPLLVA
jgi:hypothetical protein